MSTLDKLYLRALKAVVKDKRQASGGKRLSPEERGVAKLHAKWAAESPVYQAIEGKRKLVPPSPELVKKRSHQYALKEITRSYRQGWNRKKVAPEHRESIRAHARSIAEGGQTHIPSKIRDQLEHAKLQKKPIAVARLDRSGGWLLVHNIKGKPSDGPAWFIGPGVGYDVHRLIVFARHQEEAYEIAANAWPSLMYDEQISRSKLDKLSGEAQDRYEYIEKTGKWGLPSQDIRIFKKATEFHRNARALGQGSLVRLADGRVVEAR